MKGGVRYLAFTPSWPGGPCWGCPCPGRSPSGTHERRSAAACGSSSSWDGVAAGPAQQDGQQQCEGPGPRHVPSASHAHIAEFTACSQFLSFFFYLQLIKVHIDNSAPALLWIRTPGA